MSVEVRVSPATDHADTLSRSSEEEEEEEGRNVFCRGSGEAVRRGEAKRCSECMGSVARDPITRRLMKKPSTGT